MKASPKKQAKQEALRVIGEHQLMQAINSDFIMKAEEVYQYNERIVIVSDWMDGGDLTKFLGIMKGKLHEDSCKYMVFVVASALRDMHK